MTTLTKIKTFIIESAVYFIMLIAMALMGKGGG